MEIGDDVTCFDKCRHGILNGRDHDDSALVELSRPMVINLAIAR
ncbi:hypothetical protein [Rhizobium nepotum]|jgi:hypothetical protein|nr:hypothetical protein [Rhizobium nepotum]